MSIVNEIEQMGVETNADFIFLDVYYQGYGKDLVASQKKAQAKEMNEHDYALCLGAIAVSIAASKYMSMYQHVDHENADEMKELNEAFLTLHEALTICDGLSKAIVEDKAKGMNEGELYERGVEAFCKAYPLYEVTARENLELWKNGELTSKEFNKAMNDLIKDANKEAA